MSKNKTVVIDFAKLAKAVGIILAFVTVCYVGAWLAIGILGMGFDLLIMIPSMIIPCSSFVDGEFVDSTCFAYKFLLSYLIYGGGGALLVMAYMKLKGEDMDIDIFTEDQK